MDCGAELDMIIKRNCKQSFQQSFKLPFFILPTSQTNVLFSFFFYLQVSVDSFKNLFWTFDMFSMFALCDYTSGNIFSSVIKLVPKHFSQNIYPLVTSFDEKELKCE